MKTIEVKFDIQSEPTMSNVTRDAILGYHRSVAPTKLAELWRKAIPPREKLSVDLSGTCVSLMDDWECVFFGKTYGDCLAALCSIHNLLVDVLRLQVTFKMLSPESSGEPLTSLLSQEHRRDIAAKIGWLLLGALLGVLLTLLIQWLLQLES